LNAGFGPLWIIRCGGILSPGTVYGHRSAWATTDSDGEQTTGGLKNVRGYSVSLTESSGARGHPAPTGSHCPGCSTRRRWYHGPTPPFDSRCSRALEWQSMTVLSSLD